MTTREHGTDRNAEPQAPSFWWRLAKGGALVLLGAAAHLWLPSAGRPTAGERVPRIDVAVTVAQEPIGRPPAAGAGNVAIGGEGQAEGVALLTVSASSAPGPAAPSATSGDRSGLSGRAAARRAAAQPVGTSGRTREPFQAPPAAPVAAAAAPLEPQIDPAARDEEPAAERAQQDVPAEPVRDVEIASLSPAAALMNVELVRASALPSRPETLTPAVHRMPALPAPEERIERVLQAYRQAFEQLDAAAAKSVWPTVDVRALGYAFSQLAEQRLTFETCGISVSGDAASARCRGQAEYLPKVGGRRALVTSGEWVFNLARRETDWQIVAAKVN